VLTSTGETFYTAPATTPGALTGTAASPGVFEGRVRVLFDPREARLAPGEVLVAPGTDPAWTPLFLSAGALVMGIGGIMSHGSVVAREYGIPAVVGVAGATQRLRTGQRVRVDGENGLVVPL
jgi:pyruvate,water dikinase